MNSKKNQLSLLFRQYGGRLLIFLVSLIFSFWLQNLIEPLFSVLNKCLRTNFPLFFASVMVNVIKILSFNVPVYTLIFWLLILFFSTYLANRYRSIWILKGKKFKILKATYGSGNTFVDITDRLNALSSEKNLTITLSNGIPGFDPTPGVVKYSDITYEFSGRTENVKVIEGNEINIPIK